MSKMSSSYSNGDCGGSHGLEAGQVRTFDSKGSSVRKLGGPATPTPDRGSLGGAKGIAKDVAGQMRAMRPAANPNPNQNGMSEKHGMGPKMVAFHANAVSRLASGTSNDADRLRKHSKKLAGIQHNLKREARRATSAAHQVAIKGVAKADRRGKGSHFSPKYGRLV